MVIKPTTRNDSETIELRNTRLRKECREYVTANSTDSVRRKDL